MATNRNPLENKEKKSVELKIKIIRFLTNEEIKKLGEPTLNLCEAILEKNPKKLIDAIQQGANINGLIPLPYFTQTLNKHWAIGLSNRSFSYRQNKFTELENNTFLSITPLQLACYKLNLNLIEVLLSQGADPNILSSDGKHVLNILMDNIRIRSFKKGFNQSNKELHDKILTLLLCYGLDPRLCDINSNDAFSQRDNCTVVYDMKKFALNEETETIRQEIKTETKQRKSEYKKPISNDKALKYLENIGMQTKYLSRIAKSIFYSHVNQHIIADAHKAAQVIEREKFALSEQHIALGTQLTPTLARIITQYAQPNVSKQLVKKFNARGNRFHFWHLPEEALSKQEAQKFLETYKHKEILKKYLSLNFSETTGTLTTDQIFQLIGEYATDSDQCLRR